MGRLVSAILILFAVLIGLRLSNSMPFQRNVAANRLDTAAQDTRTTGFTADSTGAASESGVTSQSNSTTTINTANSGTAAGTTPLPPRTQPAVTAGW